MIPALCGVRYTVQLTAQGSVTSWDTYLSRLLLIARNAESQLRLVIMTLEFSVQDASRK